jgi:exonuclease VII small subunit
LALYEEGVSLVKLCNKILDNAAERVKIITEKEDGFTEGEFSELDEK